MYGRSGIEHYQEVTLNTIAPERLIVMLYEGIFRNLERARRAIEDGDISARTVSINKAQAIIAELKNSLDHDCGATFTRDLDALYNFVYNENVELMLDKDTVHIDNVKRVLEPIYRSWCSIPNARKTAAGPADVREPVAPGPKPATEDPETHHSRPRGGEPLSEPPAEHRSNLCVAV